MQIIRDKKEKKLDNQPSTKNLNQGQNRIETIEVLNIHRTWGEAVEDSSRTWSRRREAKACVSWMTLSCCRQRPEISWRVFRIRSQKRVDVFFYWVWTLDLRYGGRATRFALKPALFHMEGGTVSVIGQSNCQRKL